MGARRRSTCLVVLLALFFLGCAGASVGERRSSRTTEAREEEAPGHLESQELKGESRTENAHSEEKAREPGPRSFGYLEVPGFLPAPFGAPSITSSGRTPALRVLVIAHGAGGRAEHLCSYFEPHVPGDFIVVCPQGALLDKRDPEGGSYYPDHFALRRELEALSLAILERFGDTVAPQGWRYMGYSQGATMGALALVGELSIFTELVLIEGGGESWSLTRAHTFKKSGGARALLVCGTPACAKRGEMSAAALKQAGLDARHLNAPGSGHTYGGEVARLVLEEMARWEAESGLLR